MRATKRGLLGYLLVFALTTGCSPQAVGPSGAGGAGGERPTLKRIVIGMLGEPPALWDDINPAGGTVPGMSTFEVLVSAGLSVDDENGLRRAQLAHEVPSTENGLWRLFPDGRMETTWRIVDGARWHDGTPLTSGDMLFTAQVGQDREVAVFGSPAYSIIGSIETPDPQTIVVKWNRPYIGADALFSVGSGGLAPPLPKHVLEKPFVDDKANFLQIPYWTTEFVSTGPFRVREWAPSSHVVLDAFDGFAPGRPRIDQIEVRFIGDPSALMANVLAGALDLTLQRGITLEQGLQIRDQWKGGRMGLRVDGWTMIYPQLRSPTPAAIGDARFRRALVQAIDRQEMADSIMPGMAVAHSIIAPSQSEFPYVESSIVRLDYDPRRAAQLVESVGFARGTDGVFRDQAGNQPSVEIRTTTNDANQKSVFAIADYLRRLGVGGEPVVIPVQLLQNREYRATYPALELVNQPGGVAGIEQLLHSSAAPTPERNYQAPTSSRNRGQYMNPDYDALMDRYRMTIPMTERMQLLAEMIHQQTDLQLVIGVFYTADAIMIANRLHNVPPGNSWNAHVWEVR